MTKCPGCRFHALIVALRFLREALEEDLAFNWTSSLQEIHDTANLALQEAEYLETACEAHLHYLASIPRRSEKGSKKGKAPPQAAPAEPHADEPRGGKSGKKGNAPRTQAKKGSHQT